MLELPETILKPGFRGHQRFALVTGELGSCIQTTALAFGPKP